MDKTNLRKREKIGWNGAEDFEEKAERKKTPQNIVFTEIPLDEDEIGEENSFDFDEDIDFTLDIDEKNWVGDLSWKQGETNDVIMHRHSDFQEFKYFGATFNVPPNFFGEPIEYFCLYFTDEVFNLIKERSNLYQQQTGLQNKELKTSVDDAKAMISVYVLMGINVRTDFRGNIYLIILLKFIRPLEENTVFE